MLAEIVEGRSDLYFTYQSSKFVVGAMADQKPMKLFQSRLSRLTDVSETGERLWLCILDTLQLLNVARHPFV